MHPETVPQFHDVIRFAAEGNRDDDWNRPLCNHVGVIALDEPGIGKGEDLRRLAAWRLEEDSVLFRTK